MRRRSIFLIAGCIFALPPFVRAHNLAGGPDPLEFTLPAAGAAVQPTPVGLGAPLSAVPAYHSLWNSPYKLYLDFTGDTNNNWSGYVPGITPAYDTDGDANTFSNAELSNINQMWQRVSEKYSPFNIDVTTEDPGTLNHGQVMKVVIGGDGSNGKVDGAGNKIYWAGGRYGGISWVGSFAGSQPNIAYVFPGNLGAGLPRYSSEATAHEAGHGFGLVHQSDYDAGGGKVNEYSYGTYNYNPNLTGLQQVPQPGSRSPIMGNSYFAERGLWWKGPSSNGAFSPQDDLSVLSSSDNGFGYRADGSNVSFATATPLTITGDGLFHGSGVIEQVGDTDHFSFSSAGGVMSFLVDVAPFAAMLDASASIYDASGNLMVQSATSSLSEFLSADLSAGSYDLVVSSAGGYGDIGQYFITGAAGTTIPEPLSIAVLFPFIAIRLRPGKWPATTTRRP